MRPGVDKLNHVLQAALNPGGAEMVRGSRIYRVNDKVMQIRNNYDKDVFNGDIGRITAFQQDNQRNLIYTAITRGGGRWCWSARAGSRHGGDPE